MPVSANSTEKDIYTSKIEKQKIAFVYIYK